MAKEEVLIVPGELESVFKNGNLDGDFAEPVLGTWHPRGAIKREPQYIAIFVKGTDSVRVIAEVDSKKSDLDNGKISMKNPIKVNIPIRFGKDKLQKFRYTTFRRLITHKSSDQL